MTQITTSCKTDNPLIDVLLISHGTLSSFDLQASRRFYEEVPGFEVIQHATVAMLIRKGTAHTYVVVETGEPSTMGLLDHNGLDVGSREAVDKAHQALTAAREKYGIRRIHKPVEQHGTYSFYFSDLDGNWWEIQDGLPGGNGSLYGDPKFDFTGRTDIDAEVMQHSIDVERAEQASGDPS